MKLHNIHSFRILSIGFCFALVASCKKENVQTESQTNPEPQPTVQQGPSFSESEKEAQRNAAVALLAAIESDLAAGKKSIIVPPGDYRFDQRKGVRFHRLEGVEIDATGATFWFGPGNGVVFEECRNSKLLGLTIDSDPLPWTQGVIEEIDPKAVTMVIWIDEGYKVPEGKERTMPGRILFFDGQTRRELPVFDDQATVFESLGERRPPLRGGCGRGEAVGALSNQLTMGRGSGIGAGV